MHPAADQLNQRLSGTVVRRMLSRLGEQMFFPRGIVAQAAEAAAQADRFDATVGMAYSQGEPIMLNSIREAVPGIPPKQSVGYSPTPGNARLRQRWKEEMIRKNPRLEGAATSLPMVTPGLTNGLCHTADLFCDPGDVLILPDMYWGNYNLLFGVRHGVQIVTYPFFDRSGGFNTDGLREAISQHSGPRGVRVLLNFPNNPTGYAPSTAEAAAILQVLVGAADHTDIMLICDDAYFGLFYDDDIETESMFSLAAAAHPNLLTVKIDGATKEDYVWGFRIGFITIAAAGLEADHFAAWDDKLTGSIRSNVSNGNTLGQSLLLQAMNQPDYHQEKQRIASELRHRYQIVRDIVSREPYSQPDFPLQPMPFNSGYFMAFRCTNGRAEEIRTRLLSKGIGVIAFGDHLVRVAYAGVDPESLPELYAIIASVARETME
ncbi:aminotransferase class I/II-fold pyridoxal phosphate-dependent enzyme [Spirochaeta africana]|uniref:Aspartate/tyrosine/aromatic aminotransferase n=1 Tax=Spirochaeta africana (strain ATCC 700263 / DSM 8902 / Z-7692) TaxID=889378 RepID=H9ULU7_SPIAZ|nr:aminotransferase class I/II-fold pyridoxal phosphate-dependent enzyme [Spirochaeta africana]AFG38490.1 aspartate/tyrosine/aromatic aminotransferase [Spirochaeta africana DSM 8902]